MRTLALVLPAMHDYSDAIREGVLRAAEKAGDVQVLALRSSHSGAPPARRGLEALDGVVAWSDRRHRWLPELAGKGVPVVNCGSDWLPSDGIATVAVDMGTVLDLAVAHCVELSIPRLKFFGQIVPDAKLRMGVVAALAGRAAAFGIQTGFIGLSGTSPSESLSRLLAPEKENALRKRLLEEELPLAILCEDDYYARLACNVATAAGIRVSGELAVLGAGNNVVSRLGNPTISTVKLPGVEVGQEAFAIIGDVWAGRGLPKEPLRIPATELIVRESTGGKSRDVVMERTRRQIELEALKGLTFQELVPGARISPKILRRRYAEVYGEAPTDHIRRLRMEEAKRCLVETDASMAEIAHRCGFASQASFYNYFMRHEGMAPSGFRAQA